MEGAKGMARKRERHYNETKTIVSIAIIIAGIVFGVCLLVIWPQKFSVDIFNSRLTYHLILDVEDYLTCHKDYVNFVIDEPDADFALFSVYVFNVSNALNVFLKGEKPSVQETGPYGYVRNTYKYDIEFDPDDSLTVSFKEYSLLVPVDESQSVLCENMYYHLQRDYLLADACIGTACYCKNPSSTVIIVNPLFLKTMWKDSPFEMLAHYSVEAFKQIKTIFNEPFAEAVKAHLVTLGFQEVYLFRVHNQVGPMFQTAYTSLLRNYTLHQIARTTLPSNINCGLGKYGITNCPFTPYNTLETLKKQTPTLNHSFPHIDPLFNSSSNDSFLNFEYGLPKWLGLVKYFGFNTKVPYVMVTQNEFDTLYDDISYNLAVGTFGVDGVNVNTTKASKLFVRALCQFMAVNFLNPYSVVTTKLQTYAYTEFIESSELVTCSPLGVKCIWQWGYMKTVLGAPYNVSLGLAATFIDVTQSVATNPNSFYKDTNAPAWYNVHIYEKYIRHANDSFKVQCTQWGSSSNVSRDALLSRPAGLWGYDNGVSAVNSTYVQLKFKQASAATQQKYIMFASNVSSLLEEVYRGVTGFHDEYVVRYLNLNRDPDFKHNFTVGNWSDLGVAQWAGGFVTHALLQVRSTNEMIRDGMWRIGFQNYYGYYMEYSSWAIRQGYAQAYIYDVEEARLLLNRLAQQDDDGVAFRRHLFYRGSTFIGDGIPSHYQNGVGDIGELTFTPEANLGNFSCTGVNGDACQLLDVFFNSSKAVCQTIEDMYDVCKNQYTFNDVKWIVKANCANFQTSMSSPDSGIQCDDTGVYSHPHPYLKSRGNIIFQMAYQFALVLIINEGLWCAQASGCDYRFGGMFATTTVTKLLYSGYTEPSVLKYYNLKYFKYGLQFQCITEPYDDCHLQRYSCNSDGIVLVLKNNYKLYLQYGITDNDVFFAPDFIMTLNNTLLWPYSSNATLANQSINYMHENPDDYIIIYNPNFALYPALTSTDVEFNKFYQCQKRTYFGVPNMFQNCVDKLYTGRDKLSKTLNIIESHGNSTINFFDANYSKSNLFVNGSTINNQFYASLYDGFDAYPYSYLFRSAGVDFDKTKNQRIFYKPHSVDLLLSQTSLVFAFQRDIKVTIPLPTTDGSASPQLSINTRRFVEDTYTWDRLRGMGTPTDSYGMPYKTPPGMTTIEHMANFPMFIETSNSYGNKLWGGSEYDYVSGTTQNQYAQRTYVDYDPVTGRAIRQAVRQQINLKVDASVMFPIVFSSQKRCIAPSNSYNLGAGYGCWAYIPLFWFEDARVVKTETFFQMYDHFYARPTRAYTIGVAGVSLAVILIVIGSCMLTNEMYHKRRFHQRVYID